MMKHEENGRRNKSMNDGNGRDNTVDLIEEGLISKRNHEEEDRGGSYKMQPRTSSKQMKSKVCQPRKMLDKMLKRMSKNSTTNCNFTLISEFINLNYA